MTPATKLILEKLKKHSERVLGAEPPKHFWKKGWNVEKLIVIYEKSGMATPENQRLRTKVVQFQKSYFREK